MLPFAAKHRDFLTKAITCGSWLPLFTEQPVSCDGPTDRRPPEDFVFLSLPLTAALLMTAVTTAVGCAVGDVRTCLRPGTGRHRRVTRGRHAVRGGVVR